MRLPAPAAAAAAVVAAALASQPAAGLGTCPPTNNPLCFTDGMYSCRSCCDRAKGPRGDESCWTGLINFDTCCAGKASSEPNLSSEKLDWCFQLSSSLVAGRDVLPPEGVEHSGDLVAMYNKATACPPLALMLQLAMLAPKLWRWVPGATLEWDAASKAVNTAEGILQWFVDNMVYFLGLPMVQGYSAFFLLHRIVAQSPQNRPMYTEKVTAPPPVPAPGAATLADRVAAVSHRVIWGLPFATAEVEALLLDAAAAAGSNATRVRPSQAPSPCSLEAALALAARADLVRLANGGRTRHLRWALRSVQRCLDDIARRGLLLTRLLEAGAPPLMLALDRLEQKPEAKINIGFDPLSKVDAQGQGDPVKLNVQLVPVRDWESDFVRGLSRVHCSVMVRDLVRQQAAMEPGALFLDVGASLGGCSIWAVAMLRDLEVVAVEPYGRSVEALRATARKNDLEERLKVVRACVRPEGPEMALRRKIPKTPGDQAIHQVLWDLVSASQGADSAENSGPLAREQVTCARLDEIVDRRVAVMRLHVSGAELEAMESAEGLIRRGLLGAVASQFPSLPLAQFFWRRGFSIELSGVPVATGDEGDFMAKLEDPSNGEHHALLLARAPLHRRGGGERFHGTAQ